MTDVIHTFKTDSEEIDIKYGNLSPYLFRMICWGDQESTSTTLFTRNELANFRNFISQVLAQHPVNVSDTHDKT